MIERQLSDKILTVGPAPDMKGGIAQVLDTYFNEVFDGHKFIAETVNGNKLQRVTASASALFKLVATLTADKDIKIVHLHTATKVSFPRTAIYARIARLMGRKTVTHVHGANFDDYYHAHPKSVTRALKATDRIVALSESWRKFFNSEIGVQQVTVIPNIISVPQLADKPSGDVVHALFLGLLGKRKGIFDLLEALSSVKERLAGRFILHVGGNGEVDEFKNAVAAKGLGDIVEFHGWVRDDEKARLLNQSRLYILPSYGEGLPISILEAMSYGNAVISTPVGGIPEVVDEQNGALVSPGDVHALAQAIVSLVEAPDRLSQMGQVSLTRVAPHRSENVAKVLTEMYQQLLG